MKRKRTRRLDEALAHGDAVHSRAPWRIRAGVPEIGTPVLGEDGQPVLDGIGLLYRWRPVSMDVVHSTWRYTGWLLE